MGNTFDRDWPEPEPAGELTPTERFARAIARRDSATATPVSGARAGTPQRQVARTAENDQSNRPRSRCPVCNVVMVCVGEMAAALMYRCEKCRAGVSVPRPGHA